jgi:succinoglycan biosynthesis protein ExoU
MVDARLQFWRKRLKRPDFHACGDELALNPSGLLMTSLPQPSVAVIIAAYNAEATISRAVQSALAQPETAQVCVVDDCSADATSAAALAAASGDARLVVLRQDYNQGPAAARNRAIEATSAPWIAILDADDYLLPNRFGQVLDAVQDADFVADALIRVSPGTEPPSTPPAATRQIDFVSFTEFVLANLGIPGRALDLGFVKPLIKRDFIESRRMAYRTNLRLGEDYEFYARALALGARFACTSAGGYVSVDRPGSLSNRHSETDLQQLRDCDDDLARIPTLLPGELAALRRHRASVDQRLQWRLFINAFKMRDLRAAIATFNSPSVSLYLIERLAEQAIVRAKTALRPPQHTSAKIG